MERIAVPFDFITLKSGEKTFKTMNATQLKTALTSLNLNKILTPDRAARVRILWTEFVYLYDQFRYGKPDSSLKGRAKIWLGLFTEAQSGEPEEPDHRAGMYNKDDVTPYVHIFIDHCPELLREHGPLDVFACDGLEKKGHLCQVFFWRKTLKGGGKWNFSPIFLSLQKENRDLHFLQTGQMALNDGNDDKDEDNDDDDDDDDDEWNHEVGSGVLEFGK